MTKIKKWEIWGAVVSIITGSLLHFVYDWSGGSKIVAFFGAVNESTWEHLKLAFWPTLIFAIIEWFIWGRKARNFCHATLLKLLSMPLVIIVLFYTWRAFFADNFIWDISIFIIAVAFGYLLSYKKLTIKKNYNLETLSALLILLLVVCYASFTYCPPKIFLFKDPILNIYGIPGAKTPPLELLQPSGEATIVVNIDGKNKTVNLESGQISEPLLPDRNDFSGFSGLPSLYENSQTSLTKADSIVSLDRSQALVSFNTNNVATGRDEYSGNYPIIKTDEYKCVFSAMSCQPSHLIADAQKASGDSNVWFGYWDSVRNQLFGHISADGVGRAAPIFRYETETGKISATSEFSIDETSGKQFATFGSFSPSMSKFTLYQQGNLLQPDGSHKTGSRLLIYDSQSLQLLNKYDLSAQFSEVDPLTTDVWSNDEAAIYLGGSLDIFSLNLSDGKIKQLFADTTVNRSGLFWDFNRMVVSNGGRYLAFIDFANSDIGTSSHINDDAKPANDTKSLKAINLENNKISEILKNESLVFNH